MVLQFQKAKKVFYKGFTVIVLGLCITGCGILPSEEESLAPPLVVPEQISYQTTQPTQGDIEQTINSSGSLVPISSENYFFETDGGRFGGFKVASGDAVTKGTVLAEMLTAGLDTQIAKQTLLVDTLEKTYGYLTETIGLEMENSKSALNELILKKADANTIELQKIKIERQKLDATYQLAMKKNELETAKIQLAEMKRQLELSRLVSNIDGIVTFTADIQQGDYVETFKSIVSVADPKMLQLQYNGDSAVDLSLGMKAEVTYADKLYEGEVVFVPTMAPEDQTAIFKNVIRIEIKDLPETAIAGQAAKFKVILQAATDTLIVPRTALKKYNGKDIIYTLEDGLRVENYVEVGVQGTNEVEILQGIAADDTLIIQ